MSEKPKPKDILVDIMSIRNGQIKDAPIIDKTSVLPPAPTKPNPKGK